MATYTNLNLARLCNGPGLEGLVKSMLPLSLFSTSFSPEEINPRVNGTGVLVPLTGSLTATTFANNYAICGGTKSVVTVTINRHKVVHLGQNDLDAANNSDSNLETLFFQATRALGQAMVEDVLTLVTTSNFGFATSTTGTALDTVHFRKTKLNLDKLNAPTENRFAIIEAVGMDALLALTNFVQAQMFYDNTVLKEGRVMRALGFDLNQVNNSFITAADSVMAFLGQKSAIAVAMRYLRPQDPSVYRVAEMFSDQKTGATFGIRAFADPRTGENFLALECNYGFSVGISRCGQIIGHNGTV